MPGVSHCGLLLAFRSPLAHRRAVARFVAQAPARTDETVEPVFFYSMPWTFWYDIFSANGVTGVINLTPGGGSAELAAIKLDRLCGILCHSCWPIA